MKTYFKGTRQQTLHRSAEVAMPCGNPAAWQLRFVNGVVLTGAVPGRRAIWLLQLIIKENKDRRMAPHSKAMIMYH